LTHRVQRITNAPAFNQANHDPDQLSTHHQPCRLTARHADVWIHVWIREFDWPEAEAHGKRT